VTYPATFFRADGQRAIVEYAESRRMQVATRSTHAPKYTAPRRKVSSSSVTVSTSDKRLRLQPIPLNVVAVGSLDILQRSPHLLRYPGLSNKNKS